TAVMVANTAATDANSTAQVANQAAQGGGFRGFFGNVRANYAARVGGFSALQARALSGAPVMGVGIYGGQVDYGGLIAANAQAASGIGAFTSAIPPGFIWAGVVLAVAQLIQTISDARSRGQQQMQDLKAIIQDQPPEGQRRSIELLRRRNSDFSWLDNQIFGLDPGALALDLEAELNAAGTKAVLEGILEQDDFGNLNLTDAISKRVEERLEDPGSEESYKCATESMSQLERDRRGNLAEYLRQRRDAKQAEADAVADQQAKDREEEKKALEAIAQSQLTV